MKVFFTLVFSLLTLPLFSQGLSVSTVSLSHKAVQINFPDAPASGYTLFRKPEGGSYGNIASIPAGTSSYTDSTGLLPDSPYFYKILINGTTTESPEKREFTRPRVPQIITVRKACYGENGTIQVAGEHASGAFKWYETAVSATDIGDGTGIFQTPALTAGQSFFVTAVGAEYESFPRLKIDVGVFAPLTAIIQGESERNFCQGEALLIANAPGAGARIEWQLDGTAVGGDSLSFRPQVSGRYRLRVLTDSCEKLSPEVNVTVKPKPEAKIIGGENILLCDGGFVFAQTVENATYEWLNESGEVIGTTDRIFVSATSRIRLSVTLNGCRNTSRMTQVNVFPKPGNPEVFANRLLLCEGENLVLTTKKNLPGTYTWTTPTGTQYAGREVVIRHADSLQSGAYVLTLNQNGCLRQDTLQIRISPTIQFLAEFKNPTCYQGTDGAIVIHSVRGTTLKAVYQGRELSGTRFNIDNLKSGVHEITLENTDGCKRKLIFTLVEPPKLALSVSENTTTSPFTPVQLNAAADAELFIWSPREGLSDPNIPNPAANPKQTTLYKVRVVDRKGCEATDSVLVTVITEIHPAKLLTPNGDEQNDFWVIENLEYFPDNEVTVWNRWGQVVFSEKNYQNNWDGKAQGKELPEGAYYFLVNIAGGEIKNAGSLNIVR